MKSVAPRVQIPNMRGKKHYLFSCRCCVATDKRAAYASIQAARQIADAKRPIKECR